MEEIAERLGDLAENVFKNPGTTMLITTSVFALISLLASGTGENSNTQTAELQRDIQKAENEKKHALNTIDNCRKSIQGSRQTITKYGYQQSFLDAIKEIDDGVACFERLLDAKLYDEAFITAQKVAETARNYRDAVLASEKTRTDGKNIWRGVRDMVNGKIQQLILDKSELPLPSGEKLPFRLNEWADENLIEEVKRAVAAEEPPQDWTLEQIQTQGQAAIDQLNQLITESTEYCMHTYFRSQRSRGFIITFSGRGWKYKGFRYENDDPKQDMALNFDSITGDKLKATFSLDGALKLTVSVKSNNTDSKRTIANKLEETLLENGIFVNQLDWD